MGGDAAHVVDGETFEVYPNRDSVPFIGQYGLPAAWKPQTFVRGTLRLDGWLRAWGAVFEELKAGDDERIAALAAELATTYPTTEEDRDRVVLAVSLEVRSGTGATWSGRYLLDLEGTPEESAMARCVSRTLGLGVRHVLDGDLPAGLNRAAETAQRSEEWLGSCGGRGSTSRFGPMGEGGGGGASPPPPQEPRGAVAEPAPRRRAHA